MTRTEFTGGLRGLGVYDGLAKRTGKSLVHIIELAAEDRLVELFDERGFVGRPRTPEEALRRLEKMRHDPSTTPFSGAAALVALRARVAKWDRENAEVDRRGYGESIARLAEIEARRIPPWREL